MNTKSHLLHAATIGTLAVALFTTGCQSLQEERSHRGAAIGGAAGAAVGGAVGGWEGALLGGLLGAGGGYVIGAEQERIERRDEEAAREAAQAAEQSPATAEAAQQAATADINGDGFVTLDEVAAMNEAGFSDAKMLQRLEATNQVFELTPDQKNRLVQQGVSQEVVDQMQEINRQSYGTPPREDDVIGRDPQSP